MSDLVLPFAHDVAQPVTAVDDPNERRKNRARAGVVRGSVSEAAYWQAIDDARTGVADASSYEAFMREVGRVIVELRDEAEKRAMIERVALEIAH